MFGFFNRFFIVKMSYRADKKFNSEKNVPPEGRRLCVCCGAKRNLSKMRRCKFGKCWFCKGKENILKYVS